MSSERPPGTARPAGAALSSAVRMLLRPLVRFLIERGLTYPMLASLLKAIYVEVADQDVVIEGRRQTDSRISLLTGVHRRDVKRLRRELASDEATPSAVPLGALLVSRWTADSEFLGAEGKPLPLPRQASAGAGPSFESLVLSVSKDIPARSVLDEWLRLGVAEVDEDGRVRLREESFVPEQGVDEKLHFFGRNLREHIAAGAHNILNAGPPFIDRTVYYDGLSERSAEDLAELAREAGGEMLGRINRRALELQTRDATAPDHTHRMTVGAYFFSEDEAPSQATGEPMLESEESDGD